MFAVRIRITIFKKSIQADLEKVTLDQKDLKVKE